MASAGAVRAGGAFVEIFAKDGQFQQAMTRIENRMKAVGATMRRIGTQMSIGGVAFGTPMVLAARQAAGFEDALLGMRAAAGLTAEQVGRLEQEALRLSRSMGSDPAKIANAFLELTKAGMDVESVLAGAGKSAVEFARVSGVEMADAAVFMKVAMNVFGVSATAAVDTLSAAADASETSIAAMVESFALVGSAGKTFDQSLFDISQGLAALAKYGIRGEEAGTGIKTMLMRLVSPAEASHKALASIGMSVESFRDANGKLLPLVQIVDILAKNLQNVDRVTRDQVLGDVFGDRGIRVVGAFLDMGVDGFNRLATSMEGNLPVSEKFEIMMSGLSGAFERLGSSVRMLSISFGKAIGDSFNSAVTAIQRVLGAIGALIEQFPVIAKVAAVAAAATVGMGVAMIAGGIALQGLSGAVRMAAAAMALLATPMGLAAASVAAGVALALTAAYQLSPAFRREADGIMTALGSLDFRTAWEILNLNVAIAMTKVAASVSGGLQRVGNFFRATASVISDTLVGALDSFMGIFGADIITLQSGLQKLGIYLKAAFDWKFAVVGMRAALAEVEAEADRARQRAPTAKDRSEQRTDRRARDARARGQAEADAMRGFEATVAELEAELDLAHDKLKERPAGAAGGESAVERSPFREPMPVGPVPPAEEKNGKTGIGATLGTFGSSAAQLGVGPELNKIEDYGRQTAANTGAAAAALAAMADAKQQGMMARGLDGQPGDVVGPQLAEAMAAAKAAGGQPQPAGRGVAAGVAAERIPEASAAAKAGAASAGRVSDARADLTAGFAMVVEAIKSHAALTAAGNKILQQISEKIPNAQGSFA